MSNRISATQFSLGILLITGMAMNQGIASAQDGNRPISDYFPDAPAPSDAATKFFGVSDPSQAMPSTETGAAPFVTPPPPATPAPSLPRFDGPFLERSKLTGDWLGARSELRDDGITFNASSTQYYQGNTLGGREQAFEYGGRGDYFLNIDGKKAGLWQGLMIDLHGETRYGESANRLPGTLLPQT